MRKGRDLVGLPILDAISNVRLGEVEDVVINPENQSVSGLLIDKGNWFHSPKQIPVSAVIQVNGDGIKVQNSVAGELVQPRLLASSLAGKKVTTTGGAVLGSVQDVVIDVTCFKIVGYEISDGFISDLVTGRVIINQPSIVTESNHVVVVENALAAIWDSQS